MDDTYICNDNPVPVSERIKKMTDEELEKEFQERFGKFIKNSEKIKKTK